MQKYAVKYAKHAMPVQNMQKSIFCIFHLCTSNFADGVRTCHPCNSEVTQYQSESWPDPAAEAHLPETRPMRISGPLACQCHNTLAARADLVTCPAAAQIN